MSRRVGIVGYGALGRFLADQLLNNAELHPEHELAFVWNRTRKRIGDEIPPALVLENLEDFREFNVDLIVEVAHPGISAEFGEAFLDSADYFVGSPSVFANADIESRLRECAGKENAHGLYVPRGALSCLDRVLEMTSEQALDAMTITMNKAPHHLQYSGSLVKPLDELDKPTVIFAGSVRELCGYAPNNVNTMAVAAMAAPHVGFDGVKAVLIATPGQERHIITVELLGPEIDGQRFSETIIRSNPAGKGAVTGKATFRSFLNSMLASNGAGHGIHFR
jgi:predicted dinucleotide-utilizing enzyme